MTYNTRSSSNNIYNIYSNRDPDESEFKISLEQTHNKLNQHQMHSLMHVIEHSQNIIFTDLKRLVVQQKQQLNSNLARAIHEQCLKIKKRNEQILKRILNLREQILRKNSKSINGSVYQKQYENNLIQIEQMKRQIANKIEYLRKYQSHQQPQIQRHNQISENQQKNIIELKKATEFLQRLWKQEYQNFQIFKVQILHQDK